jgi:hypothetical protein
VHEFLVEQATYLSLLLWYTRRTSASQQTVRCLCSHIHAYADRSIFHRLFFEAVTFAGVGNFRNLSRFDPAKVSVGIGSQSHFHAVGGGGPLVFVSTIIVNECSLREPKMSQNGKLHKFIEGACIEGEWERLVGAIGMIINETTYKAQFQGGNVLFGTAFGDYGTCARVVWTVILTGHSSIGSSPPVNRGLRRVSVQNPFSSGPGGMGGTTLACHDSGMYFYISVIRSYFQCVSSSYLRRTEVRRLLRDCL